MTETIHAAGPGIVVKWYGRPNEIFDALGLLDEPEEGQPKFNPNSRPTTTKVLKEFDYGKICINENGLSLYLYDIEKVQAMKEGVIEICKNADIELDQVSIFQNINDENWNKVMEANFIGSDKMWGLVEKKETIHKPIHIDKSNRNVRATKKPKEVKEVTIRVPDIETFAEKDLNKTRAKKILKAKLGCYAKKKPSADLLTLAERFSQEQLEKVIAGPDKRRGKNKKEKKDE